MRKSPHKNKGNGISRQGTNKKKIIINDQILVQVNHFNYLGVLGMTDYDTSVKLGRFQMIRGGQSIVFLETRYVGKQN